MLINSSVGTYRHKLSINEGIVIDSLSHALGRSVNGNSSVLHIRVLSRGVVAPDDNILDIRNINTEPEYKKFSVKPIWTFIGNDDDEEEFIPGSNVSLSTVLVKPGHSREVFTRNGRSIS